MVSGGNIVRVRWVDIHVSEVPHDPFTFNTSFDLVFQYDENMQEEKSRMGHHTKLVSLNVTTPRQSTVPDRTPGTLMYLDTLSGDRNPYNYGRFIVVFHHKFLLSSSTVAILHNCLKQGSHTSHHLRNTTLFLLQYDRNVSSLDSIYHF